MIGASAQLGYHVPVATTGRRSKTKRWAKLGNPCRRLHRDSGSKGPAYAILRYSVQHMTSFIGQRSVLLACLAPSYSSAKSPENHVEVASRITFSVFSCFARILA